MLTTVLPRALVVIAAFAATALPSPAALPTSPWRDTPIARLEALALIETLNAELLASSSATLTLEHWCQAHELAEPALIVARRVEGTVPLASAAIRQDLQVGANEPLQYRQVELRCGEHTLSIADNWYVPSRLTVAMNQQLRTSQMPFGKVVRALSPHRETLAVKHLWLPLGEGWERATREPKLQPSVARRLEPPAALFEHRALLYAGNHTPIAEVHEVYQRDVLAFPEPQLVEAEQ